MSVECVVAAVHLRWDAVRQRPHHVLERVAQRVPVLVVEEPFAFAHDDDEVVREGDVERLRPKRARANGAIDARTIARVVQWVGKRAPLLWFYQPLMLPLAQRFAQAAIAYDCMDELSAFDFASSDLPACEAALQRRAAVIFTGGRTLYERRRMLGDRVRLYPSGVDAAHFARASILRRPQILASLTRPVCTYVGAIDERVDFAPILELAERGATVVLVGPVVKIDPARLPRHRNVHFAGAVPYLELPTFLAGTDVAIMPFAANEATRAISPTKTPEYLAARLPVVSTPIADVVAQYAGLVTVASDPAAFADACFAAAEEPDPQRRERGVELARNAGWDAIVTRMWDDVLRETSAR